MDQTVKTRITHIFEETPDTKTFRFQPLIGYKFDFLPGQFVFLYADINGEKVRRSYSIGSSPLTKDHVDLTLKLVPGGKMTTFFHEGVKVGDSFDLGEPMGKFVYNEEEGKNIVLIAGGSGIVPMMSIAKYCTEKKLNTGISLFYSCKSQPDIIFKKELKELGDKNPNFNAHITLTREKWEGHTGRIDKEYIKDSLDNLEDNTFYICGHLDFIRGIAEILKELGIDRTKIKKDVWI